MHLTSVFISWYCKTCAWLTFYSCHLTVLVCCRTVFIKLKVFKTVEMKAFKGFLLYPVKYFGVGKKALHDLFSWSPVKTLSLLCSYQFYLLLKPAQYCYPSVFIYGHRATGKSHVVLTLLKELEVRAIHRTVHINTTLPLPRDGKCVNYFVCVLLSVGSSCSSELCGVCFCRAAFWAGVVGFVWCWYDYSPPSLSFSLWLCADLQTSLHSGTNHTNTIHSECFAALQSTLAPNKHFAHHKVILF